jgi:hypothetical protein
MIETIVGIISSGIVSHPLIVFRVDVRSIGMILLITEARSLILLLLRSGTPIGSCRGAWGWQPNRSGTASRYVSIADAVVAATLLLLTALPRSLLLALLMTVVVAPLFREGGEREQQRQRHRQESDRRFHVSLRGTRA